ncbi:unnamed protein product [Chrysoparadoxa australica]
MLDPTNLDFKNVKTPSSYDKVYKDECMFSFDTPFSDGGFYVNLSSWHGFGTKYLPLDSALSDGGSALYLHEKWKKVEIASPMDTDSAGNDTKEPTKLAIGVDGGFKTAEMKYDVVKEHSLARVTSDGSIESLPYDDKAKQELPMVVSMACDAVIAHQGAAEQSEVASWEADQELPVSKHAKSLAQLDNGKKISNDPATWKCEDSGKTDNLWLNLSTGYIGSGRRNWDGSGGTGAALKHYEGTGKQYPLCVKLGTINAQGADVYSYDPDEDCMVKDPDLASHLHHWGINIMALEKTDKTMAELEVELNKSYDFSAITEAGHKLEPLSGPGYTGLVNLGNSCYMNSCLQVIMGALPEVGARYFKPAQQLFKGAPQDSAGDFITQMAKVMSGMLSGDYSHPEEEDTSTSKSTQSKDEVAPRMFKQLVGNGHQEFATGRQQDAAEYIQHLLEVMTRAEHAGSTRLQGVGSSSKATETMFQFQLEDRLECLQSNQVRYVVGGKDNILPLQIPVECATNNEEVLAYKARDSKRPKLESNSAEDQVVRPIVPASACLERFASSEVLEDFLSPATGARGMAEKEVRIKNFPRYLFLQLRRYYVDETWQAKKLDVEVEMPEVLDLESLRAKGLQPGETPLPDAAADPAPAAAAQPAEPDEEIVAQLVAMGFSENGCKRAALAVSNANAEVAMNWVLEHMGDDDFSDPLPPPPAGKPLASGCCTGGSGSSDPDAEAVAMLQSLGFDERSAKAALLSTGNNSERAADWLFSHMDDLSSAVSQVREREVAGSAGSTGGAAAESSQLEDGEARYSLVGFISHVGKNTGCGHYVAHIKKDNRWVIFDDRKVAKSETPPLKFGYLYLYRRDDA